MTTPPCSKDVPWYTSSLTKISPSVHSLFHSYAHPRRRIIPHILHIRDEAWSIHPFPCLGQFRFLDLGITEFAHYPAVLARLSNPETNEKFLDMACCFGQDIRKLVQDGAIAENLSGCDLHPEFMELGYDLFRDRSTLPAHFFAADIFDSSNPSLAARRAGIDIIHATSFLHLFPYDRELDAAAAMIRLLRPVPGSMVVGRQMGNVDAWFAVKGSPEIARHNEMSFEGLWREAVGMVEGERWEDWRVEVVLGEPPVWKTTEGGVWGSREGARRLRYKVWRV